jgi:hypothetical protein
LNGSIQNEQQRSMKRELREPPSEKHAVISLAFPVGR